MEPYSKIQSTICATPTLHRIVQASWLYNPLLLSKQHKSSVLPSMPSWLTIVTFSPSIRLSLTHDAINNYKHRKPPCYVCLFLRNLIPFRSATDKVPISTSNCHPKYQIQINSLWCDFYPLRSLPSEAFESEQTVVVEDEGYDKSLLKCKNILGKWCCVHRINRV